MIEALLEALKRLDGRLAEAAAHVRERRPRIADDAFRVLYIAPDDVNDLLARQPGDPAFPFSEQSLAGDWAGGLREEWRLSPFDADVLLIAAAPELDLRYERLYAFLQDDVT